MLYEGKAKRMFATGEPGALVMEFKDDATAFNGEKKAVFAEKGRLNCAISTLLYGHLHDQGVPTHFIRQLDDTRMLVRKVEIVPVEVIVRNTSAGSFCKRTGMDEGIDFDAPVVEFSLKSDELGDPLVNDDYIRVLGLATPDELAFLRRSALHVNDILGEFFRKAGLKLVDFKLEYGRPSDAPKTLVLADEVSPDGCRLWDLETGEKMDKDRFRRDLGHVMESYEEVLKRARDVIDH